METVVAAMGTLVRSLDAVPQEALRGALSIGNFDGVHRGHAAIVDLLRQRADRIGGPVVVLTFEPHPLRIIAPDRAPVPLTWLERKAELLNRLGVDTVVACPTDASLLQLEPEEFFATAVVERLRARAIVEGPDFRFGRNRRGDRTVLTRLCHEFHIDFTVCPPVELGGEVVSSSRIRELIRAGELAAANAMLVEPYRLRGDVVHGAGRGRDVGFPTANLDHVPVLIPALGVYAGAGLIGTDRVPAAVHIGPSPTFDEGAQKIEVHLLDVTVDLYGRELEVELYERLRPVRTFDSVDELRKQLTRDVAAVRRVFAARGSAPEGK